MEIWINSEGYFECLGMGYLREYENEFKEIPERVKKIVVGFLMMDYLENGIDWQDPLLPSLLNRIENK